MRSNIESVMECTSANFDGIVALMHPEDSWVGRWQRINKCIPGMYAVSVSGKLPNYIIGELQSHGIVYQSRDRAER